MAITTTHQIVPGQAPHSSQCLFDTVPYLKDLVLAEIIARGCRLTPNSRSRRELLCYSPLNEICTLSSKGLLGLSRSPTQFSAPSIFNLHNMVTPIFLLSIPGCTFRARGLREAIPEPLNSEKKEKEEKKKKKIELYLRSHLTLSRYIKGLYS